MTHAFTNVTHTTRSTSRLPDWATPGVLVLKELAERGVLEDLVENLRIQREGGFPGFDVFLYLLYFFAAGATSGLRPFWQKASGWKRQLAAVAGRAKLPSSSSISRALNSVTTDEVRAVSFRMLFDATGIEEVMRHPSTQVLDAKGEPWHVLHKDGTRKVFRQRALPRAHEDMPEPRRRATEAAAGFQGRKRGELQFHRLVLQHAGSGAWLLSEIAPGNGNHREELDLALDTTCETMRRLDHPVDRCVLCMDGEDGWVPSYHACRAKGVPYVTRLTRPKLLEQEDVRERMRSGTWYVVPDSGSGPQRLAMDLGIVTVRPGETTRRTGGEHYEPIDVRVVVSRFEQPDRDRGRGRKIEGWRYELYATSLASDAWPASEVVHLYYGRCGQENRFLQEDREAGLDRTFSYHLPGQAFACLVGLMLWNVRVAMGFRAQPPPTEDMGCPQRPLESDETPCAIGRISSRAPATLSASPSTEGSLEELEQQLHQTVDLYGMTERLSGGWSWTSTEGLSCPEGQPLTLSGITSKGKRIKPLLIFIRPRHSCAECALRPGCTASVDLKKARQRTFTVDEDSELERLRHMLKEVQQARRRAHSTKAFAAKGDVQGGPPGSSLQLTPACDPSGSLGGAPSGFLPAAARGIARGLAHDVEVFMSVVVPARIDPRHPLVAPSDGARQHRRLSWHERQHRNDLPEAATVMLILGWPEGHPQLEASGSNSR